MNAGRHAVMHASRPDIFYVAGGCADACMLAFSDPCIQPAVVRNVE